jgi:hypothetical protein
MVGYIFIGCVVALILLSIFRKDDYIKIYTVYADNDDDDDETTTQNDNKV